MIPDSQFIQYSSKMIKAGALLPDTKLMLEHWNDDAPVSDNIARFREANLFGKASRVRVGDVLAVFRQRYLRDPWLLRALIILARGCVSSDSLNRVLYFRATRSDRLLHDAVIEVLLPRSGRPAPEVHRKDLEAWVANQVAAGKTESPWSPAVQTRVAQGLLATLRDFGILEGAVRKRVAAVYLPVDAFAFVAFQLAHEEPSADRLLRHPDWKLFLLPDGAVERLFLEAHQERLLQYHAAGRVARIDFPVVTLPEYARVLTQSAHRAA